MMVLPPQAEEFDSLNRDQAELASKCEQADTFKRLALCQEELHYMANHNSHAPEPSPWLDKYLFAHCTQSESESSSESNFLDWPN
jgi:hypothetical protein